MVLRSFSIFPLLGFLTLASCEASVKVNADSPDKKAGIVEAPEPPPSVEQNVVVGSTSYLGVTHTLELTPEAARIPTCHCLAVAVGQPNNASFVWRGTPPTVADDALVLGISGEGTPCDWARKRRGPSIQAVEMEGADLIVSIEEGRNGIPLAHGAVIPRPQGDIVIRAGRGLPYDEPVANSGPSGQNCRIRLR